MREGRLDVEVVEEGARATSKVMDLATKSPYESHKHRKHRKLFADRFGLRKEICSDTDNRDGGIQKRARGRLDRLVSGLPILVIGRYRWRHYDSGSCIRRPCAIDASRASRSI